jgi:peptidoglycan/xylan/chitin deacetylase (PgdA/CDA1 family)
VAIAALAGSAAVLVPQPRPVLAVRRVASQPPGLWTATTGGSVFTISGSFFGSLGGRRLVAPIVAMAALPTGHGYWLAGLDGGVFSFGDAPFLGSLGAVRLNRPITGIAATPDGRGYWLVALDGGVFSFGDAHFFGGLASVRLNAPVVAITPTASGRGYWLLAADGGVFAFGDARFYGSLGGLHAVAPAATMARTRSGNGYWILGRDGGVFAFGDAPFHGSAVGLPLGVGLVPTASGAGYWIAAASGVVRSFGDAPAVAASIGPGALAVGLASPWASSSGIALPLLEHRAVPSSPTVAWPGAGEVALTFDDGPGPATTPIVAALAREGVTATFFAVGRAVAADPATARAEVAYGNEVEDHTWDHADLTRLDVAQVQTELVSTADAIEHAGGARPTCFRPPDGITNAAVVTDAAAVGLRQVLWNVDPRDWSRPGAAVIAARVLTAATGHGIVVILHDGGGDRSETLTALPVIVDGLRARGYRFVHLCS